MDNKNFKAALLKKAPEEAIRTPRRNNNNDHKLPPKSNAFDGLNKKKNFNKHAATTTHPLPTPANVRARRQTELWELQHKMANLMTQEQEDEFRARKRAYFKELGRQCPWLDWLIKDSLAELWARDPQRTCESIVQSTPDPTQYFERLQQERQEKNQETHLKKVAEATASALVDNTELPPDEELGANPSPPPQPTPNLLKRSGSTPTRSWSSLDSVEVQQRGGQIKEEWELPIPQEIPGALTREDHANDAYYDADSILGSLPVGCCHAERAEGAQDGQPQLHQQRPAQTRTISSSPPR